MDALPFVTPVYKRDLKIENYFIGYLKHPYISIYTGRGCKSRCTFCLWPQTVGGHRYRTRSVGHVIEEIAWAKKAFPQVKEFFFDDDTFTDDLPRAEAIAKELGKLGRRLVVQRQGQRAARDAEGAADGGLRLLLVGYEIRQPADPVQHQEGHAGRGRRAVHQGLPRARASPSTAPSSGPARRDAETIEETVGRPRSIRTRSRCRSPRPIPARSSTIRRSRTAGSTPPMPNWWTTRHPDRAAALSASQPHRDLRFGRDLLQSFYFRPARSRSIVGEMVRSPDMMKRRGLREGVEFFQFLRGRTSHRSRRRPPDLAGGGIPRPCRRKREFPGRHGARGCRDFLPPHRAPPAGRRDRSAVRGLSRDRICRSIT
jgi:hypothetical protein